MSKLLFLLLAGTLMASVGQLMAEHNLLSIINSLNENLNIEWNLIITKPAITHDIEHVLKNANKSLLIVTEVMEDKAETESINEVTYEKKVIHETFSHNILTIVNVNEVNENGDKKSLLLNFVKMANWTKCSLKKLHFTHILWVTEAATIEMLYNFANICWDYGFTKVLFLANQNSLYVYDRFPSLSVKKLPSLDQYYARKEIIDFHQYPVRFPITSSPPRCFRYRHGELFYTGYMYHILAVFINNFNFNFTEYPHDYDDDDKEPLLQALAAGDMDFTTFLTYPNRTFDSSDVMWNGNVYIMVPNAKPIPKYQYFQRPFKRLIWFLDCMVILMASLIIAGFIYVNQQGWDFTKSFLYTFSLLIFQNHSPICVRSGRFKLLYVMLIVYSFVMINYYLCVLSSMLVAILYEPQINNIDDLKSTKMQLMVAQADKEYYEQLPDVSPVIKEMITVVDGIVLDEMRQNLNTSYLYAAFGDKLRFFMYQQKFLKIPRVRLLNEVLFSVPIYFPTRPNLPYIQLFNRYLRNLWASGVLWKTFVNMEWYGILSGQIRYLRDEENYERLLTLEYFYSPLVLCGGGVILSIVTFVVEILYFKFYSK